MPSASQTLMTDSLDDDDGIFVQTPDEASQPAPRASLRAVVQEVNYTIPGLTQEQVVSRIQQFVEDVDEAEERVVEETQRSSTSQAAKAAKDRDREAKRAYQRELPKEVADAISLRRQEWLHSIRCCYLTTLNYTKATKLVGPAFGDIGNVSANIITAHFRKRTMRNASNWQYQAIEKAIVHVRELMADKANHRFKLERGQKRLAEHFEDFFDLETFTKIFTFLNVSISLTKSTTRVKSWCKLVYVELCRRVKMYIHFIDDHPDERKRPAVHDYDRRSLGTALRRLHDAKKYKSYRVDWRQVARKEISTHQKTAGLKVSPYKDLDEDEDAYTPTFDPDDE